MLRFEGVMVKPGKLTSMPSRTRFVTSVEVPIIKVKFAVPIALGIRNTNSGKIGSKKLGDKQRNLVVKHSYYQRWAEYLDKFAEIQNSLPENSQIIRTGHLTLQKTPVINHVVNGLDTVRIGFNLVASRSKIFGPCATESGTIKQNQSAHIDPDQQND